MQYEGERVASLNLNPGFASTCSLIPSPNDPNVNDCHSIKIDNTTFSEFGYKSREVSTPIFVNKDYGMQF